MTHGRIIGLDLKNEEILIEILDEDGKRVN